MADREPRNKNRLDLYRRLIPKLIEMDQESGARGYDVHWDDPDAVWDEAGQPGAVWRVWDQIGLSPVVQELFHVIETMAGEDLEVLEALDSYIDPLACPENVLPLISASFGYRLDESQPEGRKRAAVLGLIDAYRSRGQFAGFKVFYRLLGFRVINIYPLWKKIPKENRGDYSRLRYDTTPVTAEPVGPAGLSGYATNVAQAPVRPGSVRITDGTFVVRDDVVVEPETIEDRAGFGELIGPNGETGTINYATGELVLNLPAPAAGAVTIDYEQVIEEWPYHAARLDMEINLSPGGVPIPLTDEETVDEILRRFDETRPIHVLLRSMALVAEIRDEFSPGATDTAACATKLKNVLTGQPFPGILGLDHTYILDGALAFASLPGEDELSIYQDYLVGTDIHTQVCEDQAPLVCPLDRLIIRGVPGGDIYA